MRTLQALLLGFGALLIAAGAVGFVLSLSDLGDSPATFDSVAEPTPTSTPGNQAVASTTSEASVCGELFSHPDPSAPRSFPAEYTQSAEVSGVTIVGNERVDSRAFEVAKDTLEMMFAGNDLAATLAAEGAYIIIASSDQGILDIAEFRCLEAESGPFSFDHVCGVADRAEYPVATVNELDLMDDPAGPCRGLNILYHEVGHLVQNWALAHADYIEVRVLYQEALSAGLYEDAYASSNSHEYFAEGTQSFFHMGTVYGEEDRDWLAEYDPALFALLTTIYGE